MHVLPETGAQRRVIPTQPPGMTIAGSSVQANRQTVVRLTSASSRARVTGTS